MPKPGGDPSSGISLGDVLRLPERHPAYRRREAQLGSCTERENLIGDAKGKGASGSNREAESTDAPGRGGLLRSVRWAAHESWGLKSPRRSDEGRCIQKRAYCLAGRESKRVWRSLNGHAGDSRKQPRRTWSQLLDVSRRTGCPERSGIRRV